jgi:hypothetical protein
VVEAIGMADAEGSGLKVGLVINSPNEMAPPGLVARGR